MAVIGRLDEEVDAVLISPIAKKRRPGEEPAPDERPAPAPQRQTTAGTPSARDAADVESRAARETLPVWLL